MKTRTLVHLLSGLALAWSLATGVRAAQVQVAAAASMGAPLPALQAAFEQASGHTLRVSLGASGKLYAQIRNGAPFDVLLAADVATPAHLEAEGAAVAGTRFTYAVGRLALWSATPGRVDAQGQVLSQGGFKHLALANPQTAPYGAAAVEVMDKLGLRARLQPRWVQGESVAQAWQFVASGNAELGFVALSQIVQDGRLRAGSSWLVPAHLHQALRHDAVLLRRARNNPAAQAFLAFLGSPAARAILRSHGFEEATAP